MRTEDAAGIRAVYEELKRLCGQNTVTKKDRQELTKDEPESEK